MSSLIFDRLRLALFISLALVMTACSQSKQSETSSISFKLPKKISYSGQAIQEKSGDVSSQSLVAGYEIQRVIFNIRGPGIKNGILNRCWDDEGSDCLRLPSDDIYRIRELGTNNDGHLVQILVAAGKSETVDPTTGVAVQVPGPDMIIYYGDNTGRLTKLSGGDIPVRINVSPTSVSQGEALIKGRYLDASGTGPTGILDMMYNPGNGKPLMRIAESAIFAGWFNVFSLYDQSFTYQLRRTGDILIDGIQMAPSINPLVIADPQQRLLLEIPQHYDRYTDDQGNPVAEVESPERLIMGFFGPGSSSTSLYACAEDNGDSAPGPMNDFYQAATGAAVLQWDLTQAPSSTRVGRPKGGVLTSSYASQCDPARTIAGGVSALFNEFLFLSKNMVEDDLHMAGGFYGPLGVFPVGADMEFLDIGDSGNAAGDLKIQWSYLPGVFGQSDSIDGFEFFYRTVTAADEEFIKDHFRGGPEGPPCGKRARDIGMGSVGRTSGQSQTDIIFSGIHHQNRDFVMTMCPYRISQDGKTQYFSGGAIPITPDEGNQGCETCDQHELKLALGRQGDSNPRFEWSTILDKEMYFPKSVMTDSFVQTSWMIYPVVGRVGDFWSDGISASDIDEVAYAVNGSTAYTSIPVGNLNTSEMIHGKSVLGISGGAIYNDMGAAAFTTVTEVQIRFKVKPNIVSQYNLVSDTFTSPKIGLNAVCTPGSNSWAMQVTNLDNTNQFPNGIEDTAGVSDQEVNLRMEFTETSCIAQTIDIPVRGIYVQGPPCVSGEDFVANPEATRAFDFHFSSLDRSGRDCNLSSPGHNFVFESIWTYSGSFIPVSQTYSGLAGSILHSTNQHTVAPFLTTAGATSQGYFSVLLEAAHLGNGVNVNIAGFPVNSDFRPLGSATTNGGGEPVWAEKDATQFDSSISSFNGSDVFSAASTDPGDNVGAQFYTLKKDGGAVNEFKWAMRAKDLDQKFFRMSENFSEGGSPLILGIEESTPTRLRIWHWPQAFNEYGNYENRDLVNLTSGYGSGFVAYSSAADVKETAYIATYRPNNSNGREHFVLSIGHRLLFGAFANDGSVKYSSPVAVTHSVDSFGMRIRGMEYVDDGGSKYLVFFAHSSTQNDGRIFKITQANMPYLNQSDVWQNVPGGLNEGAAFSGDYTSGAANSFNDSGIIGLRSCPQGQNGGGKLALIGLHGTGTNVMLVKTLDNAAAPQDNFLSAASQWDSDFNDASCFIANKGGDQGLMVIPFSNSVAISNYAPSLMLHVWDITNGFCTGATNGGAHLFQAFPYNGDFFSGAVFSDSLTSPGSVRLIHGGSGTGSTEIEEIQIASCDDPLGTPSLSWSGFNNIAELPVGTSSSDTIVGMFYSRHEHGLPSGPGQRLFIMGQKSQIYQTNAMESAP